MFKMNWFDSLELTHKFGIALATLLLFLAGLGSAGLWNTLKLKDLLDDATTNVIPGTYNLTILLKDIYRVQVKIHQSYHEDNLSKVQELKRESEEAIKVVTENWSHFKSLVNTPSEMVRFSKIDVSLTNWSNKVDSFYAPMLNLDKSPGNTSSTSKLAELVIETGGLAKDVEDLVAEHSGEGKLLAQEAAQEFSLDILVLTLTLLSALGVSLVLLTVLRRSIIPPLHRLQHAMQSLARGDLATEVEIGTRDETGKLGATYNTTLLNLRELMTHLRDYSNTVNGTTQELAAQTSQQLASSVKQASSLAEITKSIGELHESAENITRQSLEVAQASQGCLKQAESVSQLVSGMVMNHQQGQTVITQTLQGIYQLKEQVAVVQLQQETLNEQAIAIQQVMELVETTSDELRLLALNASIEAAGNSGQGLRFGVVATEIKTLAVQFEKSSKAIRLVLNTMLVSLQDVSVHTRHSLEESEQIAKKAQASEEILRTLLELSEGVREATTVIVTEVKNTAGLALAIEAATSRQKVAYKQMYQEILQTDSLTNQNLGGLRQTEQATQVLQLSTRELARAAAKFRLVRLAVTQDEQHNYNALLSGADSPTQMC